MSCVQDPAVAKLLRARTLEMGKDWDVCVFPLFRCRRKILMRPCLMRQWKLYSETACCAQGGAEEEEPPCKKLKKAQLKQA